MNRQRLPCSPPAARCRPATMRLGRPAPVSCPRPARHLTLRRMQSLHRRKRQGRTQAGRGRWLSKPSKRKQRCLPSCCSWRMLVKSSPYLRKLMQLCLSRDWERRRRNSRCRVTGMAGRWSVPPQCSGTAQWFGCKCRLCMPLCMQASQLSQREWLLSWFRARTGPIQQPLLFHPESPRVR